jgi:hypothetical protein
MEHLWNIYKISCPLLVLKLGAAGEDYKDRMYLEFKGWTLILDQEGWRLIGYCVFMWLE